MEPYHPYQITRRVAKWPKSPGKVRVPFAKAKETLLANDETNQEQVVAASWATSEAQYRRLIELLIGMLEDHKQTFIEQAEAFMTQIETLKAQVEALKAQVEALKVEMTATIGTQLTNIKVPSGSPPSPSYTAIARTLPNSYSTNLQSLFMGSSSPSVITDTLHCTINTSRVEEGGKSKTQSEVVRETLDTVIRAYIDRGNWRCVGVTKDLRNPERIRVTCRVEEELHLIMKAVKKVVVAEARIMRDQLYPLKLDNMNEIAILIFGKENNVLIAKIA